MLRLKQRTTPLPLHGAVALLERLLQIGRLGKGRVQLGVLVFGRLAAMSLVLMSLLGCGGLLPQAIHLGLEPALIVSQLAALLAASTRACCASATLAASALRCSTSASRRLL